MRPCLKKEERERSDVGDGGTNGDMDYPGRERSWSLDFTLSLKVLKEGEKTCGL